MGLFEATTAAGAGGASAGRWIVHEVAAYVDEDDVSALKFGAGELAELVRLVDSETITLSAGKEVLADLAERGGSPKNIVSDKGLEKLAADDLDPVVRQTLADHSEEVAAYRDGKTALLGFFMGQVMRATSGAADAGEVRKRLQQALADD